MQTNLRFGRRTGVPRQVGNIQITPESLVLLVQWDKFGYVWNWPLAVSVSQLGAQGSMDVKTNVTAEDGLRIERHAIVDVTRLLLWSMWAATLFMVLVAVLGPFVMRARKRKPL